ncbi:MAG: HK97 gp10 family phage protein [Aquabacterium sp.]|uniref:HK97 gp10 family phage protein n=1 Tax=Aquabacterium sp. TaxID=1872578 RepID=UPI0011FA2C66|nr:HK97 gp10 family phage protein [Aquabacterium sp.]TAK84514.1 MAG: HK97 gp10 family phage protein [Aquabacterium sp.]
MSFSAEVDLSDLEAFIDQQADAVEASIRPAAQAGAQVLYEAVVRNVASIGRVTGNLQRSIYQVFSEDKSNDFLATYHVSWNARKAPHGHLVEYGHLQRYEITYDPVTRRFTTHKDRPLAEPKHVAAHPFIRPAQAAMPAAIAAAKAELYRRLDTKS